MAAPYDLHPYSNQSSPNHHQHVQLTGVNFYYHSFLDSLFASPIVLLSFPGKPFSYLPEANASPDDREVYLNLPGSLADGSSNISLHKFLYHLFPCVATSCAGDCHLPAMEYHLKDDSSCNGDSSKPYRHP